MFEPSRVETELTYARSGLRVTAEGGDPLTYLMTTNYCAWIAMTFGGWFSAARLHGKIHSPKLMKIHSTSQESARRGAATCAVQQRARCSNVRAALLAARATHGAS